MTRWVALTREDIIALHERITPAPVRDEDLLASAVGKPWAGYLGVELHPGLSG